MRKTLAALAVAALALAGCGTTGEDEATVTKSPVAKSTSATTSATSSATPASSTTEERPAEEPVEQPMEQDLPVEQSTAPTFVRCYLADGTALMSDGSTIYMDTCNESAGGPYLDLDGNPIGPSANGYSPTPTFDPDSADGYGPNQELPPFCERFPDYETC